MPRRKQQNQTKKDSAQQPPLAQERAAEKISAAQLGETITWKFYTGEDRVRFEELANDLAGDHSTKLREILLRQHGRNPVRLADYIFDVLCEVQPLMLRRQSLTLDERERIGLVERHVSPQAAKTDPTLKRDQEDLWQISAALPARSDFIRAGLILCLCDRWRFRKALKALFTHWQQIYKPGSQWRRQDMLAFNSEMSKASAKHKALAVAAQIYEGAGLPNPKNATEAETALRVVRRDRSKLRLP
jgi:hypothetical protein